MELDDFTDIKSNGKAAIHTLYDKRPDEVSRKTWELLVDSLITAYGNVCFSVDDIDNKSHRILVQRMQSLVKKDVDISTIYQIWDLLDNVSPKAREYVSRHKITLDDFPDQPTK